MNHEVMALADRLRLSVQEASSESFGDALHDNNDDDYDTVCLGLSLFLNELRPEDWKSNDFGPSRAIMWGYLGANTPGISMVVAAMRRWLSDPQWQHPDFGCFRDFASDLISTRSLSHL